MARTFAGATSALILSLAAVGCGGDDDARTPFVPPPLLYVTPKTAQVLPGGGAVTFTALLRGANGTVYWQLDGVGTLSAPSGPSVVYLPPASVTIPMAVTVTARAAGMIDSAAITVDATPPPGSLVVSVTTTGWDFDPDGYRVLVDGGVSRQVTLSDSFSLPVVSRGSHTVTIDGLSADCAVAGAGRVQVDVAAGQTASVAFAVHCGLPGSIELNVGTTGQYLDLLAPGGFLLGVDGGAPRAIAVSGRTTLADLPPGIHALSLSGLPASCAVTSQNPLEVEVLSRGAISYAQFAVACAPLLGAVRVTTATTGVGLGWDGYQAIVSCDQPPGCVSSIGVAVPTYRAEQPIAAAGSAVFEGVPEGLPSVTLSGLARNCSVSGPNPRSVAVRYGQTTDVAFAVECVAPGSLAVTAATTGVDLDPDGYRVTWSGAGQTGTLPVPANGSAAVAGLLPGQYQLIFGDVAPNCDGPRTATATVVAGAATPVPFDVACAPDRGLAFVTSADGNPELYLVHSNGTGPQRLTVNPAADHRPAWSPDGARIAFDSDRDGNAEIYVMDADGSNPVRLTTELAADYWPAWSPDGTRIAFVSERDGNAEIYVMNADGSSPVRLTNDAATDHHPDWSPDGARIAFHRSGPYGSRIYVMNADGTGAAPVTPEGGTYYWLSSTHPAWSPDGARIAFSREESDGSSYTSSIVVINADGTGDRRLLSDSIDCSFFDDPGWSRDGRHLAVHATVTQWCMPPPPAEDRILVIRQDGTDPADLVRGLAPAWRP